MSNCSVTSMSEANEIVACIDACSLHNVVGDIWKEDPHGCMLTCRPFRWMVFDCKQARIRGLWGNYSALNWDDWNYHNRFVIGFTITLCSADGIVCIFLFYGLSTDIPN